MTTVYEVQIQAFEWATKSDIKSPSYSTLQSSRYENPHKGSDEIKFVWNSELPSNLEG